LQSIFIFTFMFFCVCHFVATCITNFVVTYTMICASLSSTCIQSHFLNKLLEDFNWVCCKSKSSFQNNMGDFFSCSMALFSFLTNNDSFIQRCHQIWPYNVWKCRRFNIFSNFFNTILHLMNITFDILRHLNPQFLTFSAFGVFEFCH
jgi:hypothetical protein